MLLLYDTRYTEAADYLDYSVFYAEIPKEKVRVVVVPKEIEEDKGQTSSSLSTAISNYENLPPHLMSCFDYCYIVTTKGFVRKRNLIHLLMAQGLIPVKPGEFMEDTGANILDQLLGLGLLEESRNYESTFLKVSYLHRKLFPLQVGEEKDFIDKVVNSPIHLLTVNDGKHLLSNFKSLQVRSLFVTSPFSHFEVFSPVYLETVCGLQFLSVLILEGSIEYLPEEIGNLVNLQYLGLDHLKIRKLPCSLGNLLNLQTLRITSQNLLELPVEILNNKQLRHLLIDPQFERIDGIRVPKGFATFMNLQSLTGVSAAESGFASELSILTQLRELDLHSISEVNADEISAAIMNLDNLISLSLHAEKTHVHSSQRETKENFTLPGHLPEFDSFSPPPHLQKLQLRGSLVEIPIWLLSLENLIKLDLYHSNLLENPSSVLQFLPKLKHLSLFDAYRAKVIGKEFCEVGRFPELEILEIHSQDLTEWTEIVNGAFPKLRVLRFDFCFDLRFLPEGLQNISTLQELYVEPLHGDLARRLSGEENYKIKHISKFYGSEL